MSGKTTTLLLLRRDDEILLAMKKRGFGAGRWNGVGGKLDPGETIEQALVRECQEEIGVTPTDYTKVAVHDFVFADGSADMLVHAFVCTAWQGEPVETEEMAPQWFKLTDIPYDDMWQDDIHWLPEVLAGKKLHTRFSFDLSDNLLDHHVHEASDV
jgi:mutator protein MutT